MAAPRSLLTPGGAGLSVPSPPPIPHIPSQRAIGVRALHFYPWLSGSDDNELAILHDDRAADEKKSGPDTAAARIKMIVQVFSDARSSDYRM
jgi:hypothetical protein